MFLKTMSGLWILLLLAALTEAYQPALLITNKSGVFYHNVTTGKVKTVIPFSFGATYVDYNRDKEIYAILNSSKPEAHKIVRVQFRDKLVNHETCEPTFLPDWCIYDKKCAVFCSNLDFENISQVIMPKNCMYASNLVVDWKNDNLYWSCQVPSKFPKFSIKRANTKGKLEKQLKEIINGKIWDMKIDPYVSKLFWLLESFPDKTVSVISSNLDAGNDVTRYTFEATHEIPSAKITLDIHNQKLYLTQGRDNLVCMNYDGTDEKAEDPTLLREPFDTDLSNVTRSKLYHPLLQTQDLKCPEHGCSGVCQLLTWRGVECIIGKEKSSEVDTDGSATNTETTTLSSTDQKVDVYTENVRTIEIVRRFDTNLTADGEFGISNGTSPEAVSSSAAASSSGRLAIFLLVFMTIWSSVLLVGLIIKRTVNQGIYYPPSADGNIEALT